jgi:hypothetical protein
VGGVGWEKLRGEMGCRGGRAGRGGEGRGEGGGV